LFVVFNIVESILFGHLPYDKAAATGASIIVQAAYIFVTVLIALGLVGLYMRQAEQAGVLGLIAFLVTFIGGVLTSDLTWGETFLASWLAEAAPELLEADPSGALAAGVVLSYLLFALGWLLLAWPHRELGCRRARRRWSSPRLEGRGGRRNARTSGRHGL
jgi:hypothetical protein